MAAGLRTPCLVQLSGSHEERQVGVEPRSRQRREQREDPREVWAVPDRPRPGRALGTGGAVVCRAHSSGAGRPSLAFPRGARPAAQPGRPPGEPRLPRSCGRRRHRKRERRRRPLSPRVRGAREAEREAGWPRASVRARPESCGAEDPHPERPAWPLAHS